MTCSLVNAVTGTAGQGGEGCTTTMRGTRSGRLLGETSVNTGITLAETLVLHGGIRFHIRVSGGGRHFVVVFLRG